MYVVALATLVSIGSTSCGFRIQKVAPTNDQKVVTPAVVSPPKPGTRKPVENLRGRITSRAVKITLKVMNGPDEEILGFFLDEANKAFWMTDDQSLYKELVDYLPAEIRTENDPSAKSLLFIGPTIEPFTFFSEEQFKQLGDHLKKMGYALNEYKIARISNYNQINPLIEEKFTQKIKKSEVYVPAKNNSAEPSTPAPKKKSGKADFTKYLKD